MIFYVGLVLFQVPGCIGYRVLPPYKVLLLNASKAILIGVSSDELQWIAFGVCGWAIVSLLQDTATNNAGLLVCRIFLGTFEGLFGTGIVYYLSLWYHRHELGLRVFWFLGPTELPGMFALLSARLRQANGFQGFRWLDRVRCRPRWECNCQVEVAVLD